MGVSILPLLINIEFSIDSIIREGREIFICNIGTDETQAVLHIQRWHWGAVSGELGSMLLACCGAAPRLTLPLCTQGVTSEPKESIEEAQAESAGRLCPQSNVVPRAYATK